MLKSNFYIGQPTIILSLIELHELGNNIGNKLQDPEIFDDFLAHYYPTNLLQVNLTDTLDFRINVQDVYSLFKLFSNLYAVIWAQCGIYLVATLHHLTNNGNVKYLFQARKSRPYIRAERAINICILFLGT